VMERGPAIAANRHQQLAVAVLDAGRDGAGTRDRCEPAPVAATKASASAPVTLDGEIAVCDVMRRVILI